MSRNHSVKLKSSTLFEPCTSAAAKNGKHRWVNRKGKSSKKYQAFICNNVGCPEVGYVGQVRGVVIPPYIVILNSFKSPDYI